MRKAEVATYAGSIAQACNHLQFLPLPLPLSRIQRILTVHEDTPALATYSAILEAADGTFEILLCEFQILILEAAGLKPDGLDARGFGFLQQFPCHRRRRNDGQGCLTWIGKGGNVWNGVVGL